MRLLWLAALCMRPLVASAAQCPADGDGQGYSNAVYDVDSNAGVPTTGPKLPPISSRPTRVYGAVGACVGGFEEGFDGGEITVGATIPLHGAESTRSYAKIMRYTIEIFLDWLNLERPIPGTNTTGGLMVGGKRYSMRWVWTDDFQSPAEAAAALAHSVRREDAHFAWGGYGSTISRLQAEQAELDGKLMMASIGANPNIFEGRQRTFGALPPDYTYLASAVRAVAHAATDEVGIPAVESLRVGFLGALPVLQPMCEGVVSLVQELGMTVAQNYSWMNADATGNGLPRFPNENDVDAILARMRADNVNFIIGCTYHDIGEAVVEGLERLDFTVHAAAFTSTVDISAYQSRVDGGWWQGEYYLGVSPWHSSLSHPGEFSGMTSAQYLDRYETRYGEKPSYHGPASFSAACALAAAVEQADSLSTADVVTSLLELELQELGFYSPMSFSAVDSNGQNRPDMLVLQYPPSQKDLKIVYPLAVPGAASLHFPTPSWGKRRCVALGSGAVYGGEVPVDNLPTSECSGHGTCMLSGEHNGHEVYKCICTGRWQGDNCDRLQPVTNVSIALLFPHTGDASAVLQLQAAHLAIQIINSIELIPNHRLQAVEIDTALLRALRDNALQATQVDQISLLLQLEGVVAAVGAGYSSDVSVLAPAMRGTMLLSPSASAASLSNVSAFPAFGRLAMSDLQQSIALADLVQRGGWKKVGVVQCDDLYCRGLTQGTIERIADLGIDGPEMLGTIRLQGINAGQESLESSLDAVRQWLQTCDKWPEDSAAVVLLLTHKREGEAFLTLALNDETAPELPTDWIGSEAIGSSLSLLSNAAQNEGGVIALRPGGLDTSHSLYETLAAEHPDAAANAFSLRAFDAVYVIAHAIRALLDEEPDVFVHNVTELLQSVRAVSFEGASGDVRFDRALDRVGSYDIIHFTGSPSNTTLALAETVGAWNAGDRSVWWTLSPRFGNPCIVSDSDLGANEWTVPILVAVPGLICLLAMLVAVNRRNSIRRRTWSTFISHSKRDAGDVAATLKRKFDRQLTKKCGMSCLSSVGPSFLDVEALDEITASQLVQNVKRSKVFVLLLSRSLLTRLWCLLEIYTALVHHVPIVPVLIKDSNNPRKEYSFSTAASYLANLENWAYDEEMMQSNWGQGALAPHEVDGINVDTATAEALRTMDATKAERTVVTPTGERLTLADIQRELSAGLPGKKAEPYDPQASRLVQDAQIAVIIKRIKSARATEREDQVDQRVAEDRMNLEHDLARVDVVEKELAKLRKENQELQQSLRRQTSGLTHLETHADGKLVKSVSLDFATEQGDVERFSADPLERASAAVSTLVSTVELDEAGKSEEVASEVQSLIGQLTRWAGWGGVTAISDHDDRDSVHLQRFGRKVPL